MATIAFDVYHYFMREAGDSTDAWLISGNPFDVIGAVSAGMKSAWVKPVWHGKRTRDSRLSTRDAQR